MTVKQLAADLGYEYFDELPDMDDAFIGFTVDGRPVYDLNRMVQVLVKRDGMTEEDAAELIDYNLGFEDYCGKSYGPVYVNTYNLQ